jgi:hypothetical protein
MLDERKRKVCWHKHWWDHRPTSTEAEVYRNWHIVFPVIYFMSNDMRWEVDVCFVDTGRIVDPCCLTFFRWEVDVCFVDIVAHSFSFLCCVFWFVCLRSVFCAQYCTCLWIVYSWLPLWFSLNCPFLIAPLFSLIISFELYIG